MKSLLVNALQPYKVTVTDDWADFDLQDNAEKVAIITDETVASLYLKRVASLFRCKVFPLILPPSEATKSIDKYEEVIRFLYQNGFGRGDAIVSLGGGVIGDLTGFVASTYMRGIRLYHIPTTIISATDSSVGGKTAIDFLGLKNAIGTFYSPSGVFVNVETFKTLPKKQIDDGLGEVIKYALLSKSVNARKPLDVSTVYECVKYKAEIVEKDEFDKSVRALLNLGHTVGHAIESLSGFTLSHGECVYKGLYSAIKVSKSVHGLTDEKYKELLAFLDGFCLKKECDFSKESILEKIKFDKKLDGDEISFITVCDFGDCRVTKLSLSALGELL